MKVLVTGSTGYIGSYLLKHETRLKFRSVVRGNPGQSYLKDDKFMIESFSSHTDWTGAFEGIDAVLHMAALNNNQKSESFEEVNHLATVRLAKAAVGAGVKRFVFLSTSHVNGSSTNGEEFTELMETKPHGSYAQSKANAEKSLLELGTNSEMEIVILRPAMVYGADSKNNFLKLVKLIKISPFLPFGMAHRVRSFISIANLTDLIYEALIHPKAGGEIFLIADSTLSMKDFTNAIAKGLGKKVFQLHIPISLFKILGKITGKSEMISQIFNEFKIDSTKLKTILDWRPKSSMSETMETLNPDKRPL